MRGIKKKETALKIKGGCLAFGPMGDYVRFVDSAGREVAYFDKQEWAESPAQVMEIIGYGCVEGVEKFAEAWGLEGRE